MLANGDMGLECSSLILAEGVKNNDVVESVPGKGMSVDEIFTSRPGAPATGSSTSSEPAPKLNNWRAYAP